MKQASLVSVALCLGGMVQACKASGLPIASATISSSVVPVVPNMVVITDANDGLKPGDINCRYTADTRDMELNSNTCAELAKQYHIRLIAFFVLNPTVHLSCDNLKPDTGYCVRGFIEPLRAYDRKCGPPNGGATCIGTRFRCCNSQTWKCGNTGEDCSNGICYEGACAGDSVYTTNGECGYQHGYKSCAGKWGDCCNMDGKCGTGEAFCSVENCQLGNCAPRPPPPPKIGGRSEDGTCGAEHYEWKCWTAFGKCCSKDGKCGKSAKHCGDGCQPLFGTCSSSNTTSPTKTNMITSSTETTISNPLATATAPI